MNLISCKDCKTLFENKGRFTELKHHGYDCPVCDMAKEIVQLQKRITNLENFINSNFDNRLSLIEENRDVVE